MQRILEIVLAPIVCIAYVVAIGMIELSRKVEKMRNGMK